MHRPSFFSIFSLTIKDKTNILHLRQGSFTRKVRTVFTLKMDDALALRFKNKGANSPLVHFL
jgi:hypothetical protein